jgi:hypothetical protein
MTNRQAVVVLGRVPRILDKGQGTIPTARMYACQAVNGDTGRSVHQDERRLP